MRSRKEIESEYAQSILANLSGIINSIDTAKTNPQQFKAVRRHLDDATAHLERIAYSPARK